MLDICTLLSNVNIEKSVRQGITVVKDHLPMIFSASALGCLGFSLYETAVATHKSDEDIIKEEARRAAELPLYENTKLTTKEKVELCWRNYIKAALYGGACAFFIVAAERKGNEKYLAMLSAYELTKKADDERKAVELDILGEEKTAEIDKAVRQRMVQDAVKDVDGIQSTGSIGEKSLYVEYYTNTVFWATYEDILHAFNYVNHKKQEYGKATINDFLEDLGLRKVPLAESVGWNRDQGLVEPILDEPILVNDDPTLPATTILYDIEPREDCGCDWEGCFVKA